MKNMTCKELVKEAAKIIYQVHDEVKDKMFELELSWVSLEIMLLLTNFEVSLGIVNKQPKLYLKEFFNYF